MRREGGKEGAKEEKVSAYICLSLGG